MKIWHSISNLQPREAAKNRYLKKIKKVIDVTDLSHKKLNKIMS